MEKNNIKGFNDPEIQNWKDKLSNNIDEIENAVKDDLKNLKKFIEFIEYDHECLNRIKEEHVFEQKHKKIAHDIGISYKKEDIEKIKEDIKNTQSIIDRTHERINLLASYKISFKEQVDELKNLEDKFKEIILKIEPNQLQ
ncbi:MAG: hypothetical protein WC755_06260 [Candidatus Woesearchaeota archaeon]|jgi:hypothetical protein